MYDLRDPDVLPGGHRVPWGHQNGGFVKLRFRFFLNFPYTQISLLVGDSGVFPLTTDL